MFSKSIIERLTCTLLMAGFVVFVSHLVALNAEPTSGQTEVAESDSVDAVAEEQSQESLKKYFVVLFTKGPAYVQGGPNPGMAEHVKFIKARYAESVVPLAGLLFEGDEERPQVAGLLYIVRAGSLKQARGIAVQEPLVKHKVVEIESIWQFMVGVGVGRLD